MGRHTAFFFAATEHRRSHYTLPQIHRAGLENRQDHSNRPTQRAAGLQQQIDSPSSWALTTRNSGIVANALLAQIGAECFNAGTEDRVAGFANGYGSILLFDDPGHTQGPKDNSGPLYSDKAEECTHHSNGIHQYCVWFALETHGLGG